MDQAIVDARGVAVSLRVLAYGIAVFLGAFLLFEVKPRLGTFASQPSRGEESAHGTVVRSWLAARVTA